MHWPRARVATVRVVTLVLLVSSCVSCGGHGAAKTRTVPGEPGLQYDVHGSFLYLLCMGRASPTVILESGLAGDHRAWSLVQPELARTTRVCSYDRSGLGLSQLAPKRRTAREKTGDLHGLLRAAGVHGPFVLVGHSYGGMLVRVYAAAYPTDVAGLVLVDSSHPDAVSRFLAALSSHGKIGPQTLRGFREGLALLTRNAEGVDWTVSSDEARAAGSLGDKPLIVVTAGQFEPSQLMPWPAQLVPSLLALPPRIVRRLARAWLSMQNDLARLSKNRIHVIAVHSAHMVMSSLGQPELVIRAIRAVVEATRSHTHLPRCRDLFKPRAAKCAGG